MTDKSAQGSDNCSVISADGRKDAMEWALTPMRQERWKLAAERWATLRSAYPNEAPVWIQAAICHRRLGDWIEAERLLRAARERFPGNVNAWLEMAALERDAGESEKARYWLNQALERFPKRLPVMMAAVEQAIFDEHFEEAERLSAQACSYHSDSLAPWRQYAELAMKQGAWSEAITRWSEVRSRFPTAAAGYNRAAVAAEEMGDPRLARRLRLAKEYGIDWLASFDEPAATSDFISPPERRSILQFLELVWVKACFNLKSEANQNYLRYFWWLLDPVLYMSVFYLVFGLLLSRGGGENFIAYLLTGLVPFQWFAKTVQQSSGAIFAGRGLMHQVHISPLFFPLVAIVQNAGKQMPVFLLLIVFLLFFGLSPSWHWLGLVPVVLLQLLLMSVLGCFLALLIPFVRDLSNLIPTGIQFMLFCSGVFYSADTIPEKWRSLFFTNPMANLLYQYRQVLMEREWPDWVGMSWVLLGCLISGLLLLWFYRRVEGDIPKVVVQ